MSISCKAVSRSLAKWRSGRQTDGTTITEAVLIPPCGSLNPDHPGTAETKKQITAVIEKRPPHRPIAPDEEVWLLAGILSGTLARF
jgi:hypothetical protein